MCDRIEARKHKGVPKPRGVRHWESQEQRLGGRALTFRAETSGDHRQRCSRPWVPICQPEERVSREIPEGWDRDFKMLS